MYLKTLSLVGFKSFADRTRIECEEGVTVVVGPNGSGKSNLVDAIAWVMGTQATTSLRTSKMEDVIFAGTEGRRALGRAEVALTVADPGGELGKSLADVTITRRLYRDGTSEYEMNGTSCRLLDIQELLADAGVGRHQHVIVGQGRVDEVLNAGPEEHRAVIEEAAGVVKHRSRRDRAVRRLEATDGDVVRLVDLLEEQRRRMRPLRRQAKAAERHEEVRSQWMAARLWVGGESLRVSRRRLAEVAEEEAAARSRLDAARKERDALGSELAALQAAAGETGEALDRDVAAASRLETAAERFRSLAVVARERRAHLERSAAAARERRAQREAEEAELGAQLAVAAAEERAAAEAADKAEIVMRALEDEERSLAEASRLPAEGLAASLRGDLAALEAAESRDARESGDVSRRRGAVAAVIEEELAEAGRLQEEIAVADADRRSAAESLARSAEAAARDRSAADSAAASAREADMALVAARARLEALESAGAGSAAAARKGASSLSGVVGPLLERLDVPEGLEAAVTAALGPWTAAFAATGSEAVDSAMAVAKSAEWDGVGFVAPVGSVPEWDHPEGAQRLVAALGRDADEALAAGLLGDVVLVDDWRRGRALVADHPHLRVVTPNGDLITAAGILSPRPSAADEGAIREASEAVAEAVDVAARAQSRLATALRERERSDATERQAAADLEAIERRIGGLERAHGLLERSRSERTAELERLDARSRSLAEAAAGRAERVSDLRSRLSSLDGGDVGAWDDLARRRESVAQKREVARLDRERAAAALAAASTRRQLLERRLDDLGGADTPEPGIPRGAAVLERVENIAEAAMAAVRRHTEVLRGRSHALRDEAGDAGARLGQGRERREQLGADIEEATEIISRLAVEAAELRVREESALEGLRRDADAGEDEALAAPEPEWPEGATPTEHVEALAARLRRLGPVNPLAAAEYRDLAERVAFVEGQLADLDESRSELRKVIAALDDEIGRLFRAAFDDIAAKFSENFELLFPGGKGTLALTDPDDVLNTGVDIQARPMGKKVGRLQLLSGGERSLAALAFLFAVFRSRPSPFYVLDEVEAALDAANLARFLRLVGTLRDTSQLVIVTHQQQTMEAADLLYGVTMEPGDSSRVVAKRLTRV